MDEIFYRFNPWWEERYKPHFIKREKYLKQLRNSLNSKDVVFITGLRRAGKTTLMKLFVAQLIEKYEIDPRYIFYVSLDFYGLEKYSILEIIEQYLKIQKVSFSEKIYIFLDEIGYKKDFNIQLKNIYDSYNAKVFASSSSVSVLKDKKALLTGRERIIEMLPLDFEEFLQFKDIRIKKSDKHLLESYFEQYMKIGGIPEFVLTEDVEYIKQLVDDVIYKDIIVFHGIKEKSVVRDFFYLLMERTGKQFSLNKISKVLGVGVDTVRRYFDYFQQTYLIYPIERCGKLNTRIKSPKKIYVGDVGIKNAVTGLRDKGAIFENLVFFKIKNKNICYVYENGVEIDFFIDGKILMEVKYNQKMNKKQKNLFDSIKAEKKIVIDSIESYLQL